MILKKNNLFLIKNVLSFILNVYFEYKKDTPNSHLKSTGYNDNIFILILCLDFIVTLNSTQ